MSEAQVNKNSGNINCDWINVREGMSVKGPISSRSANGKFTIENDTVINGSVTADGDLTITGNLVQPAASALNSARLASPNEPEKLGTSTSLQSTPYQNIPFLGGGEWSTSNKIELDSNTNKFTIPSLKNSIMFDLVPLEAEAGAMNSEITGAGYGNDSTRLGNSSWYGLTMDDKYFYYSCWKNSLFAAFFGFGSSNIFVCRRKIDGKLIWVRNSLQYSLETPGIPSIAGSGTRISRITLAINGDRLYTTSMFTNIGAQLFCINKNTGERIWSMAYKLPSGYPVIPGGVLVAPTDVAFNSVNTLPYRGQTNSIGDLHIVVTEITPGVPSILVGLASFQNALAANPIWSDLGINDKGALFRIDDLGATGTRVWEYTTCVPDLNVGDTISAGNINPLLDSYRDGETTTLIWRFTTSVGTFADVGGVTGKILNQATYPGFNPTGGVANNNTMPAAFANTFGTADLPLTEANFPDTFKAAAPGIGAAARIYQGYAFAPNTAKTMADCLVDINAALPALIAGSPSGQVRVLLWCYLTGAEVTAINGAAFGATNADVRYIAELPTPFTIQNADEARALNYYGCSIWSAPPVVDRKRNLVYVGTGQTQSMPLDEELFYQDPAYAYRSRIQPLMDAIYGYGGVDPLAPVTTLTDVQSVKESQMASILGQILAFTDRSPRGNRTYYDAMVAIDLTTGELQFGHRTMASDVADFTDVDNIIRTVPNIGVDADASGGLMYFDNVKFANGSYGDVLATVNKAGHIHYLDISGYNPAVVWDHTNLTEKGIIPTSYYAGPVANLGGTNYASAQSGGSLLVYYQHNGSTTNFSGTQSVNYQINDFQGWEFHITQDGRVLPIRNSLMGAFDVAKKEIVWEHNIGQASFSMPFIYNGVVFLTSGGGVLMGLDLETGKKLWAYDAGGLGLGGVSPPILDGGRAYVVSNYLNAKVGKLGNKGLIMDIDTNLLIAPGATLQSVTESGTYVSFDVIPKNLPVNLSDPLVMPENTTHVWNGTTVSGTHVIVSGPTLTLTVTANKPSGGVSTFVVGSTVTTDDIRYLNIQWINKDTYILNYQRLVSGVWTNYEVTFKKQ